MGVKELPHIQQFSTAKETWDAIEARFIGNDSMRRTIFDELSNEAKGFYMLDDESHEDMFRRLTVIATDFKSVGAEYIDDAWIKRKYVNALMPFESIHLNSIKGRESYPRMSSTEVMQEICSFKMATKLAHDSRNRALGMSQGSSKALKARVVSKEVVDEEELSHEEELTPLKQIGRAHV